MKKASTLLAVVSLPIVSFAQWTAGTGKLTTTDKVGIGVSSPVQALEVNGNGAFYGTVYAQNFTVMDVATVDGRLAFTMNMFIEGYDPIAGTRNHLYTNNQDLFFQSEPLLNRNIIMTYGNTGRVGIGTNAPAAKLHVVGDAKFEGEIAAQRLVLGDALIEHIPAAGNMPNIMKYGLRSGGHTFSLNPCFAPHVPLIHAYNGLLYSYGAALDSIGTNTVIMGYDGANGVIDVAGTHTQYGEPALLLNYTCGKNIAMCTGENGGDIYMTTAITGRIGIGTNNPVGDFHLNKANGVNAHFGTTSNNSAKIWVSNSVGAYTFGIDSTGTGQITDGASPVINFMHGNVGIGTACLPYGSAFKLHVNGKIVSEGIKVDLSDGAGCWPDYVFESNYTLQPLPVVEQFIRQNKHLPNVPSAAEVAQNGISLENNDMILLEKIEELTLYLIEQQKQIAALKQEITTLKTK